MTPQEINIAICKLRGWSGIAMGFSDAFAFERILMGTINGERQPVPSYHSSLDACAEFEKTLSQWYRYFQMIEEVTGGLDRHTDMKHTFDMITATAPQRCKAFLRLHNKWRD